MNALTAELALDARNTPALSGVGLLGLVTTGMYDAPLSVYREYIQNAADSAAGNGLAGKSRVDIAIDVAKRRIKIRDNGPGLSPDEALCRLLPIGRSDKSLGIDRGFRGVGRLAGLAFAKTVSFATRAHENQAVTRITWHSGRLPKLTSTASDLEEAILDCVDVDYLPGPDYPRHFFEVEIKDVARHSANLLLNREAVRKYIGEVCPVPVDSEFPFFDEVEGLLRGAEPPLTMEVVLEGDPRPVERPYGGLIQLSAVKKAEFTEFEVVRIPSVEGSGNAAVGWVAHSRYLGAIPKEQRVRGIKARAGNIQIGGEAVFDHLFTEERFNRWCVGELHILDSRIIPNGRRDYFEPGPHLRNLENQLSPVLRNISTRCRRESTVRNRARKTLSALRHIEDLYALASSGYLSSDDSVGLVKKALGEIEKVRDITDDDDIDNCTIERFRDAEDKLNGFSFDADPLRFGDMSPSEVAIYQRVFGVMATLARSPGPARELIEMVFAESAKLVENDSNTKPDSRNRNLSQARLVLDDSGALTPT